MYSDERLYKAFLAEMQALEGFRMAYAAEHPSAPLGREDPDVRRLVEALAFFAGRSRLAGQQSIAAVRQRLLRQLLPYLLTPLPAMGIVQAVPTGRFAETTTLPRGTEMELRSAGQPSAIYRTLRDLRVLPITMGRVDMLPRPDGGIRILLPFQASYPRNDEIGRLGLLVDFLDDFPASLSVIHALKKHLRKVTVSFEDRVDVDTKGASCTFDFGLDAEDLEDAWPHPIQRERAYFHYPTADLFLNVEVPEPPRNWRRFVLCLDVDANWPRGLRLSRNVIQMFSVPVVNVQRCMCQPILCDGKKEQWPIRHPRPAMRMELQTVHGVYRVTETGLVPMRPGTLAGGSGSYELSQTQLRDGRRVHELWLHLPDAFAEPCTVSVDASWYQPWFARAAGDKVNAAPYRRNVAGLDWEVAGAFAVQRAVALEGDIDELMHVLVLQNKSRMDRDDIDTLLLGLGSVWAGPFAPVRALLAHVDVREVSQQRAGGANGVKLVYELRMKEHEKGLEPLVAKFAEGLQRILDAWIGESPVEVRVGSVT